MDSSLDKSVKSFDKQLGLGGYTPGPENIGDKNNLLSDDVQIGSP